METFVFLVHAYEIGERYIIERRDALTFCSLGNSVSHSLLSWLWSDLSSLSNEPVHTLTELALLFTIKSQFEGKSLTNCLCLPRSREDRFYSCFDSSKLWLLLLLAQKLRRCGSLSLNCLRQYVRNTQTPLYLSIRWASGGASERTRDRKQHLFGVSKATDWICVRLKFVQGFRSSPYRWGVLYKSI